MNELTFTDIFIGANGLTVLISSMLLALLGNLFKKYKRFQKREDNNTPFNWQIWLRENADDMVVGFFATYVLVRLLNVLADYVIGSFGASEFANGLDSSDSIVLVSVLIGYYTDSVLDKIFK